MSFNSAASTFTAFFLGALLLVSCGGGGSGGGGAGAGPATTDMLITDATVDELLAFKTTIFSLRLVSTTGIAGNNLLSAPLTIDLIGAGAAPRWVAREDLPEGTFRGVAVSITPLSTTAIDRGGAAVAVTEVATAFELPFSTPSVITSGVYRQIMLDIDLMQSLSGLAAAPPISFDPTGTAKLASGGASTSDIDEVKGVVQSADSANSRFVIDAFADGDLSLPLGNTTVELSGTTLLLDENGSAFASKNSFFAALLAGTTLLEVHGTLTGGVITASRVEVEDDGIGGSSYTVKIDGRISNLDTVANTFTLQIIEIEKGSAIATPIISGASSISVSYTNSTGIVLDENTAVSESSLAEGQRVKVKFPTFVIAPFPVSQIEIDAQPEFEGQITSVAGLPNTITLHLESDEPAIASGQVQNSSTSVVLDISASTLFLGTNAKPSLTAAQLQVGLKLEVRGALSGPANAPTIIATETKIHPGRFKGVVLATFANLHAFNAGITDLKDPFGNSVVSSTVSVNLDPSASFDGDAVSEANFFALFSGLTQGETLEVEVFGLGTVTTADEILCYEIKSKVH